MQIHKLYDQALNVAAQVELAEPLPEVIAFGARFYVLQKFRYVQCGGPDRAMRGGVLAAGLR